MIDELTRIYLNEEDWHESKLSKEESKKYFEYMLKNERIYTYGVHDQLLGYVETWRIGFDQFGRLLCRAPFNVYEEDLVSGPICFLWNIWIHPEYRKSKAIKKLRYDFFRRNMDAEYFGGEALRKYKKANFIPLKIFTKQQAYEKWAKGVI